MLNESQVRAIRRKKEAQALEHEAEANVRFYGGDKPVGPCNCGRASATDYCQTCLLDVCPACKAEKHTDCQARLEAQQRASLEVRQSEDRAFRLRLRRILRGKTP